MITNASPGFVGGQGFYTYQAARTQIDLSAGVDLKKILGNKYAPSINFSPVERDQRSHQPVREVREGSVRPIQAGSFLQPVSAFGVLIVPKAGPSLARSLSGVALLW